MEEKYQAPRVSVVIPALNEAQNLRHVLPLIPPVVTEIVLVDGHSTDDTIAVVQQLGPAIRPPIHIITWACSRSHAGRRHRARSSPPAYVRSLTG